MWVSCLCKNSCVVQVTRRPGNSRLCTHLPASAIVVRNSLTRLTIRTTGSTSFERISRAAKFSTSTRRQKAVRFIASFDMEAKCACLTRHLDHIEATGFTDQNVRLASLAGDLTLEVVPKDKFEIMETALDHFSLALFSHNMKWARESVEILIRNTDVLF